MCIRDSLVNIVVNLFVGVAAGTTVVIAQSVGASDAQTVQKTVHASAALALWGGLAFTAVGVLVARPALTAMGTPEDVMDYAVTYLSVYFFGSIPSLDVYKRQTRDTVVMETPASRAMS